MDAYEGSPRLLFALTQPMRGWSARARWMAIAAAVLLGLASVLVQVPLGTVFHSPDSSHYLKIASGHTDQVMQPFASRQLGALTAAWLGRVLGIGVLGGFLVQAALSLTLALGVTCWLAACTEAPRWLLVALVLVPSWPVLAQYLVLPDLWYAALLSLLLVLLAKEQYLGAALMMLPLMLSRESTSLTLVCFLGAGWVRWQQRKRWVYAGTAVGCAAVASVVVERLAAGSQMNKEHLPQAIYLVAKVPWNFVRNVIGIMPWSNVNTDLCKVPVWSMPVHLGSIHALGTCGFSVYQQLIAVEGTLTNFGLLPLLVAVLWWRHRRWVGRGQSPARSVLLRFALLYGGVCYVLAPVLGAGFVHLMQYAWPLFLVAVPLLLQEFPLAGLSVEMSVERRAAQIGFLALHLGVQTVLLLPWFGLRLTFALVIWGAGYVCLRRWLGKPGLYAFSTAAE